MKLHQFVEDAGPQAHPIRPDSYIEMNNFYTSTVYHKGAEVIRMIETILGKEGFQDGMQLYFKRHDGQAVTCEDFIKAMEDATSTDLTLFRNWYTQAGTPEVEISSAWDSDKEMLTITFVQSCQPTPGQLHKDAYLIPFRMALYSKGGDLLDIRVESNNQAVEHHISDDGKEIILQLSQYNQTLVFSGLGAEPILSLLRGFCAPIKIDYQYQQSDLALLLSYDNDSYSNWEAGQSLMISVIKDMTAAVSTSEKLFIPDLVLAAFETKLNLQLSLDPSLLAMTLKVPGLDYLVEQFEQVALDELVMAYNTFNQQLADHLKEKLNEAYKYSFEKASANTKDAVGWRRLANACLTLLDCSSDQGFKTLAQQQFEDAKDMTNSLAALKVIAHGEYDNKPSALDTFYQRWQDEELVLDKWFSVQATNPAETAISDIYNLLEHADFQLSNPNKVRALIGSFAKSNLQNFHRADGAGYQLVGDVIVKLNKINPQIAARLTASFNRWKHFDDNRKTLMQQQLKRMMELKNVSPDVYEIASKAIL